MSELLIEYVATLVIGAILGAAVFFSVTDSALFAAYGGLLFWVPFFGIPLMYYGLIKIVIFRHI